MLPTNSTLQIFSTSLADCICNLGYTGQGGGFCSACAAGKYKNVTGNTGCTNCLAGQYLAVLGAISRQSCLASSSPPSCSTVCRCNMGYTGPESSSCSACVAGKYKAINGSLGCTNCLVGHYLAELGAVSNVCLLCNSPAGSDVCLCNLRYTGPNSGSCLACVARTYTNVTGSAGCTTCLAAQYSGATSDGKRLYELCSGEVLTDNQGYFCHIISELCCGDIYTSHRGYL